MGDQTHVSTRVMGTYGYAAPEYVMTGKHLVRRWQRLTYITWFVSKDCFIWLDDKFVLFVLPPSEAYCIKNNQNYLQNFLFYFELQNETSNSFFDYTIIIARELLGTSSIVAITVK